MNSRCKGLLEIAAPDDSLAALDLDSASKAIAGLSQPPRAAGTILGASTERSDLRSFPPSSGLLSVIRDGSMIESKVQYPHATVKDFFEDPRVWDGLNIQNKGSFDPHITLCRSYIIQFKVGSFDGDLEGFWRSVKKCMSQAYLCEKNSDESRLQELTRILDEFDCIAQQKEYESLYENGSRSQQWRHWINSFSHSHEMRAINPGNLSSEDNHTAGMGLSFLTIAVSLDLYHYVVAKLDFTSDGVQNDTIRPLLLSALSDKYCFELFFGLETFPSPRMVSLLLSGLTESTGNLDLNVWNSILNTLTETQRTILTPSVASRWLLVIADFLKHGVKVSWPFEGVVDTIFRYAPADTKRQVKPTIDSAKMQMKGAKQAISKNELAEDNEEMKDKVKGKRPWINRVFGKVTRARNLSRPVGKP